MSYFIAMNTTSGWKARNRNLYPTKAEAETRLQELVRVSKVEDVDRFRVFDAEHEPGRSILKTRHGFA